jgi:hypothetical protein
MKSSFASIILTLNKILKMGQRQRRPGCICIKISTRPIIYLAKKTYYFWLRQSLLIFEEFLKNIITRFCIRSVLRKHHWLKVQTNQTCKYFDVTVNQAINLNYLGELFIHFLECNISHTLKCLVNRAILFIDLNRKQMKQNKPFSTPAYCWNLYKTNSRKKNCKYNLCIEQMTVWIYN